jgi:hypothetical protein
MASIEGFPLHSTARFFLLLSEKEECMGHNDTATIRREEGKDMAIACAALFLGALVVLIPSALAYAVGQHQGTRRDARPCIEQLP